MEGQTGLGEIIGGLIADFQERATRSCPSTEDTSAWMVDLGAFERLWKGPETAYLLTEEKRLKDLAGTGVPFYPLARAGKNVLGVNRPMG